MSANKGYAILAGSIGKGMDALLDYVDKVRRKKSREEYERVLREIDYDAVTWLRVHFGMRDNYRVSGDAGEADTTDVISRRRLVLNQDNAKLLAEYIASLEHGYDKV